MRIRSDKTRQENILEESNEYSLLPIVQVLAEISLADTVGGTLIS
jgi:hypothetical protein